MYHRHDKIQKTKFYTPIIGYWYACLSLFNVDMKVQYCLYLPWTNIGNGDIVLFMPYQNHR